LVPESKQKWFRALSAPSNAAMSMNKSFAGAKTMPALNSRFVSVTAERLQTVLGVLHLKAAYRYP